VSIFFWTTLPEKRFTEKSSSGISIAMFFSGFVWHASRKPSVFSLSDNKGSSGAVGIFSPDNTLILQYPQRALPPQADGMKRCSWRVRPEGKNPGGAGLFKAAVDIDGNCGIRCRVHFISFGDL